MQKIFFAGFPRSALARYVNRPARASARDGFAGIVDVREPPAVRLPDVDLRFHAPKAVRLPGFPPDTRRAIGEDRRSPHTQINKGRKAASFPPLVDLPFCRCAIYLFAAASLSLSSLTLRK